MKETIYLPCYIDGKKSAAAAYYNGYFAVFFNSRKMFDGRNEIQTLYDSGCNGHQFSRAVIFNQVIETATGLKEAVAEAQPHAVIAWPGSPEYDEYLSNRQTRNRSGATVPTTTTTTTTDDTMTTTTTTTTTTTDDTAATAVANIDLSAAIIDTLTAATGSLANMIAPAITPAINAAAQSAFDAALTAATKSNDDAPKVDTIRLISGNNVTTIAGLKHAALDCTLQLLNGGRHVYLYGPAGTGKSYAAKQAADLLNLPLYQVAKVDDIYTCLCGFRDAHGVYHATPFYEAYKNGGVWSVDEIDASDPTAVNWLLGALENGRATFADEIVEMHPNFKCVATGNTNGTGATCDYNGRNVLDAAFRRRFAFVFVDYDNRIDLANAGGDKSLFDFVRAIRQAAAHCGVSIIASSAEIKYLHQFDGVFSRVDNISYNLLKGLEIDQVRLLASNLRINEANEWAAALKSLAA